jgi:hypothetical protein
MNVVVLPENTKQAGTIILEKVEHKLYTIHYKLLLVIAHLFEYFVYFTNFKVKFDFTCFLLLNFFLHLTLFDIVHIKIFSINIFTF